MYVMTVFKFYVLYFGKNIKKYEPIFEPFLKHHLKTKLNTGSFKKGSQQNYEPFLNFFE
jgi:hypothetical protein